MAVWEILTICIACASIAISLLALGSVEKTREKIETLKIDLNTCDCGDSDS